MQNLFQVFDSNSQNMSLLKMDISIIVFLLLFEKQKKPERQQRTICVTISNENSVKVQKQEKRGLFLIYYCSPKTNLKNHSK